MKDDLIIVGQPRKQDPKPEPKPAPQDKPAMTAADLIRRCSLRPLGPQIVVMRDPVKEKTKGGLYLPQRDPQAKRKVTRGTIIRVGPGGWDPAGGRRKIDLAPGDRVVFGEFTGIDITHPEPWGDQVYTLMQDAEILSAVDTPSVERVEVGARTFIHVDRSGVEHPVELKDIKLGYHFRIETDDPDDYLHGGAHVVYSAVSDAYQAADGVWTVNVQEVGLQKGA